MKKSKIAKFILIVSLAAFIGLLVFYLVRTEQNRPKKTSKREEYQNELLLKEKEGNE